jgi:DNA-binding Lrp family transcriptional regulator
MITDLEKKIIASIQEDMAICGQPYLSIAQKLGISESRLLSAIDDLVQRGIIRRFGATIRHQKSGFEANAMVAWAVDEARVEQVGEKLAGLTQVTHCYRRDPSEKWPYNLYTMIHAADEDACKQMARDMASNVGVDTYSLLFSRRELKKTSMKYFPA